MRMRLTRRLGAIIALAVPLALLPALPAPAVATPAIAAGSSHSLALKVDSTVWAWGSNVSGQLGDGTTTDPHPPVHVTGFSGVTAIAAGGAHSLALKSNGMVWGWGANGCGQLGDGTATDRLIPVQVM